MRILTCWRYGVLRTLALCLLPLISVDAESLTDGQTHYTALRADYDRGDCQAVLRQLADPVVRAALHTLAEQFQIGADMMGLKCVASDKRGGLALPFLVDITQFASVDVHFWIGRAMAQVNVGDYPGLVETVNLMAAQRPDGLNALEVRLVGEIDNRLRKQVSPDVRRQFLRAFATPGYHPDETGQTGDRFRVEYARLAADAGDEAAAAAAVSGVVDPRDLKRMLVDPQLRRFLPADFDLRRAIEKRIASLREIAAAHAETLSPILEIATLQRELGQDQESLATLEQVHPDRDDVQFADKGDQLAWWWDGIAETQSNLNHYDLAVSAIRHAMDEKISAEGPVNISQTINLAWMNLPFHKYAEAVELLSVLSDDSINISDHGRVEYHAVSACAKILSDQKDAADVDLAFLRAHGDDGLQAAIEGLGCANDIDGAAKLIIRQLESSEGTVDALLALSDYEPEPPARPVDPVKQIFIALKARSDVQAAVQNAGGASHFDIPGR